MNSIERAIAEAAINSGKATTYEKVQEEASRATGIAVDEVKKVVKALVDEHILWERGGPAQNVAEGAMVGAIQSKAWYDRGGAWPKD